MARIEECKKCRQPFAINDAKGELVEDYQEIDCPHCGDMWGKERTEAALVTTALTPEQHEEYRSQHK
jgi:hypothetical protein